MKNKFTIILLFLIIVRLTGFSQENLGQTNVIYDLDLTNGKPEKIEAIGGVWDNGWLVKANGDKLIFDAGYNIAKGYMEITFTMSGQPDACVCKNNWFGGFEYNTLSHQTNGDIIYVRAGQSKYGYSRMKAYGKNFDATELEHTIGSVSNWVMDGKTEQRLKLSWNGTSVSFDGTIAQYTNSTLFNLYPVDEIRYAFVGGDNTYGMSLIGLKVLTFKLVDENFIQTGLIDGKTKEVEVFPNPSYNIVSIYPKTNYQIELIGLNGAKILSSLNASELNIEEVNPGFYLMKILNENSVFYKRIMVVKKL